MIKDKPKVSIGIPVFNGEKYISQAIESILAQTFTDYELIIVDNASTDRTQQICKHYAEYESRIRYVRNEKNLGAAPNFNRTFELSSGKYFKWAAHDDLIAPDFLEQCVRVLDDDPDVVLCFTDVDIIDENDYKIDEYRIDLDTDVLQQSKRFRSLLLDWHMCYDVFGLIRSDALRLTPVMGSYGHGDGVLLARLGLLGKFHRIPTALFFSRSHSNQSMQLFSYDLHKGRIDYHSYSSWFDTSVRRKLLFPRWRLLSEYFSSFWNMADSWNSRLQCASYLLRWAIRMRKSLWEDILYVGRTVFGANISVANIKQELL